MIFETLNPLRLVLDTRCLLCGADAKQGVCRFCLGGIEALRAGGCARCANPFVGKGVQTCAWCQRRSWLPAQLHACFAYRGSARALFKLAKFQGYVGLLKMLTERLEFNWDAPAWRDYEAICSIPESPLRWIQRHYHPADYLAAALIKRGAPPQKRLLRVRAWGPTQVGLDLALRSKNIRDRFQLRGKSCPASVILVDDVLTTGATLEAASQVLRRAGCKRIAWFTLFRTP